MSIAVVSIEADRAMIAVDTCCEVFGHPEHVESAKVHLLPHAGLVLVGLGDSAVADAAFRQLMRPGRGVDFDLCTGSMRSILDDALQVQGAEHRVSLKLSPDWFGGCLVYLVGWSARTGRMAAHAYINSPGAANFSEHIVARWSVHPRDYNTELTAPTTLDELEAMAASAVRYGKRTNPGFPFGGRLVLCELRQSSMTARTHTMTNEDENTGTTSTDAEHIRGAVQAHEVIGLHSDTIAEDGRRFRLWDLMDGGTAWQVDDEPMMLGN